MNKSLLFVTGFLLIFSIAFCQTKDSFSIHFAASEFQLTNAGIKGIDSFLHASNDRELREISLKGYCDSKGSINYNDRLSAKRVESVHRYLEGKGIPDTILFTEKSYGERALLNGDKTAEESLLIRRVEIIFTYTKEAYVKNLSARINDSSTKIGMMVPLPTLLFKPGKTELLPVSLPLLREIREVMLANPNLAISIEGHICCGPEITDPRLKDIPSFMISQRRAMVIWYYLTQNGISEKRLSYKGFGNTHPIYPFPEKTPEEEIANRRVELRIISK